jgi:hypothetical protein
MCGSTCKYCGQVIGIMGHYDCPAKPLLSQIKQLERALRLMAKNTYSYKYHMREWGDSEKAVDMIVESYLEQAKEGER